MGEAEHRNVEVVGVVAERHDYRVGRPDIRVGSPSEEVVVVVVVAEEVVEVLEEDNAPDT